MISKFIVPAIAVVIALSVSLLLINFEEVSETRMVGVDQDKDRIDDREDNCPKIKNEDQTDFDKDNIGNPCDPDDDNDGIVDNLDVFDANPQEWADFNFDGVGSIEDNDDDNDGIIDSRDIDPTLPSEDLALAYLDELQNCAKMDDGSSRLLCSTYPKTQKMIKIQGNI